MQHADAAGIIGGLRGPLPRIGEVLIGERLESYEYARASGERHGTDQGGSSVTSIETAALQILYSGRSASHSARRYSRLDPRLLSMKTA